MSVAPSFQNLEQLCEPFIENGKEYVIVKTKSGTSRKVRWYEEPRKKIRSYKDVLGFEKGYITIFKGDTFAVLEWFRSVPQCRFHNWWGWYVISTEELPEIIPAGVTPIKLYWDDIAMPGKDELIGEAAVKAHLETLLYDATASEYQGEVGERIERALTVIKAIPMDGYYGASTMHIFKDDEENEYVWSTASKSLPVGESYLVRGTIKELKTYKGSKQTVLTRCKVS